LLIVVYEEIVKIKKDKIIHDSDIFRALELTGVLTLTMKYNDYIIAFELQIPEKYPYAKAILNIKNSKISKYLSNIMIDGINDIMSKASIGVSSLQSINDAKELTRSQSVKEERALEKQADMKIEEIRHDMKFMSLTSELRSQDLTINKDLRKD
jgi:hypothetical protein